MGHYWIIKTQDTAGRTMYLARVRPTKYSYEISDARHYDDEHVKRVSNWLVDIGVSHSIVQFSNV